jgi:hypothetical protein
MFEGENYLSDQMFILEVSQGTVRCLTSREPPRQVWSVITRRNVAGLPPWRVDDFETREEAEAYKRRVFPAIPRVFFGGHSLVCPCGAAARGERPDDEGRDHESTL